MALRADMGVEGCLRRGASAFQGQRGALRTWLATRRDHLPCVLQDRREAAGAGYRAPEAAGNSGIPSHQVREGNPRTGGT